MLIDSSDYITVHKFPASQVISLVFDASFEETVDAIHFDFLMTFLLLLAREPLSHYPTPMFMRIVTSCTPFET